MQNNPKWWKDPKKFNPERWQPGFIPETFSYMPFYVGSRGCLGKHLAMMLMKLTLSVLARNFSMKQAFDPECPPIINQNMAVMRIINKVNYLESTNPLFVKSCTLKFVDLVYLKTLEIMFRANNNSLPPSIQCLFKLREGNYNLRGFLIFELYTKVRTNIKARCISVLGVKKWNSLSNEIKSCTPGWKFKKALKGKIVREYSALS